MESRKSNYILSFFNLGFRNLDDRIQAAFNRVFVLFGSKILECIPGRVSTEVDSRYYFCRLFAFIDVFFQLFF